MSKVPLTKGALRELDRRNALSQSVPTLPCSSHERPHRQFTRHVIAKVKKSCRSPSPASDILRHWIAESLKDIKRLARHGDPDLLDLRGICIT